MLVIAALSWRFIEQPFRSGVLRIPRRPLFTVAAAAAFGISALAAWAVASNGIPSRFSPETLKLVQYPDSSWDDPQWHNGCFAYPVHPVIQPGCLSQAPGHPDFLLFGDSHAAHLNYGLTVTNPEIGISQATAASCKPLLASRTSPDAICRQLIITVFDRFLPSHRPAGIILAGLWEPTDAQPLADTVAYLHAAHLRVYVLGPSAVYDQPLPDLLVKSILRRDPTLPARHLALTPAQFQALDTLLANAAVSSGAYRYISLRQVMCPAQSRASQSPALNSDSPTAANDTRTYPVPCLEYAGPGVPLQFDTSHFTPAGSVLIAGKLRATDQLP